MAGAQIGHSSGADYIGGVGKNGSHPPIEQKPCARRVVDGEGGEAVAGPANRGDLARTQAALIGADHRAPKPERQLRPDARDEAKEHERAVTGQPHIELDPGTAERLGAPQPRQRIFRGIGRRSPVADDRGERRADVLPVSCCNARRQTAACAGSGCRLAAPRSSPVCWSTWRMLSFTLPRSSKPRTFTLTVSPILTTSATLPTRCCASSLM